MKLAAAIIAYQPDVDEVFQNVLSYIDEVEALVVYQNSPVEHALKQRMASAANSTQFNKVLFLGTGENVGIATALNEGVRWARSNNYTHILTLDQDSNFKPGVLAAYKKLIEETTVDKVGVFGINPNNWGHLLYHSSEPYIEVADTITSGSVSPIAVFDECGYFEDDLFIDAVDYEFCYRLKSFGYKTIVFPAVALEHRVGHAKKTWLGFKTDNYSAFRTYFIIRNHIVMWKRYPAVFPGLYKRLLIKTHIIGRIVKIILTESQKYSKIKAIITGLIHGLQGKLGYYKA